MFAADLRSWGLNEQVVEHLFDLALQLKDDPLEKPNYAMPSQDEQLFCSHVRQKLLDQMRKCVSGPPAIRRPHLALQVTSHFIRIMLPEVVEKTTIGTGPLRFFFPGDARKLLDAAKAMKMDFSIEDALQLSHSIFWWLSGALPPTLLRLIKAICPDLSAEWLHAICDVDHASKRQRRPSVIISDSRYEVYHRKLVPSGSTLLTVFVRQHGFEDNGVIEAERPLLALLGSFSGKLLPISPKKIRLAITLALFNGVAFARGST